MASSFSSCSIDLADVEATGEAVPLRDVEGEVLTDEAELWWPFEVAADASGGAFCMLASSCKRVDLVDESDDCVTRHVKRTKA